MSSHAKPMKTAANGTTGKAVPSSALTASKFEVIVRIKVKSPPANNKIRAATKTIGATATISPTSSQSGARRG